MRAREAFLKLRAAASFLQVHPNTLRSLVTRREVPGVKIGRDWRFLESNLVRWMRCRYPDRARVQLSADLKEE
jgi:excisionase family DNA binding protein